MGLIFQRFRLVQPPPVRQLADDGLKIMSVKKSVWLRALLKGNRFKISHSTCTHLFTHSGIAVINCSGQIRNCSINGFKTGVNAFNDVAVNTKLHVSNCFHCEPFKK